MFNLDSKTSTKSLISLKNGEVKEAVIIEVSTEDGIVGEVIGRCVNDDILFSAEVVDGAISRELGNSFTTKEKALEVIYAWFKALDDIYKKLSLSEDELKGFSWEIDVDLPYDLYVSSSSFMNKVYDLKKLHYLDGQNRTKLDELIEFRQSEKYNEVPDIIREVVNQKITHYEEAINDFVSKKKSMIESIIKEIGKSTSSQ